MPCHQDRVQRNYDLGEPDTSLNAAPCKTFEADVRLLLDYLETEYVGPDLGAACKRLRKVVGWKV